MIVDIVLYVMVAMQISVILLVVRNQRVYNYKKLLLDKIDKRNVEELRLCKTKKDAETSGRNVERRYMAFDAVSYNKMVFTFWKPIKSFYDEGELLK